MDCDIALQLPKAIAVGKEDETQKYNSKKKMEIGMTTIRSVY